MTKLLSANYLSDYKIAVTFSDGKSGVVDCSEYLWGPMFEPLRDLTQFQSFEISPIFDTICWQNGADIAPESLCEKMK